PYTTLFRSRREGYGFGGQEDRYPPLQQRVIEAPNQRVAHHQPGATREAKAIGAGTRDEPQAVAQRREGSSGIEEMADVGAVDHHAAKQHELGQRWAQLGERFA